MEKDEIIKKVMDKKEFRELPFEDVGEIYSIFEKRDDLLEEEKIKETRKILIKMYTSFLSSKSFNLRDRDASWFLKKHKSTKEREGHYDSLYNSCLSGIVKSKKEIINIFDFGCGLNGFSYRKFLEAGFNVNYVGTEPVGQLSKLQNEWFKSKKFRGRVYPYSLFDLKKNLDLIKKEKGKKVAFFFKVFDSLEILKRNYSKEVLNSVVPLVDRIVVSWATKSLGGKKKIYANKKWLLEFISENFNVLEDFSFGDERYLVFEKK